MHKNTFATIPVLFFSVLLAALGGCADLSYYLHSINGHYAIVERTNDIDDLLENGNIDQKLVQRLRLVKRIRAFAFEELQLPESDSYSVYADLQRPFVLKNLFAASEFSVAPHQWCYPVVGCAGYRGFFDEQRLNRYIDRLKNRNYDVYVANVPAYSTLGWFDDPVLNTFVHWPEERLAGLIFHELTHQQLYIDGDSAFNESFAVAVQQIGVERWLQVQGREHDLQKYRTLLQSRRQVLDLIAAARIDLQRLYDNDIPESDKRQAKQDYIQDLKQRYISLSNQFDVTDGFQHWFSGEINNAKLASISTYHSRVPAFRNIFRTYDGDFAAFYRRIEEIAALNVSARSSCLEQWMNVSTTSEPLNSPSSIQACINDHKETLSYVEDS